MEINPELIKSVLALPLEARRLFAQRPGPGWWVLPISLPIHCESSGTKPDGMVAAGWAWLPADAAEWMEAATPEGGAWTYQTDRGWRIWDPPGTAPGFTHSEILADAESAPSCALAALRARFPTPREEETP